jgi:hypothetical protein
MVEVELSDLKKVGKDISELLGQRLRTEVTVKGGTLLVPDEANGHHVGVKDVKMQVKHVLHHLGLSEEYRVLTEHHKVRIVKVEEKLRPAAERKASAPPPSQSLPYFFP